MFKKFAALAAAAALSLGVMTGCGVSGTTADSTGYSAENPLVLTLAHGSPQGAHFLCAREVFPAAHGHGRIGNPPLRRSLSVCRFMSMETFHPFLFLYYPLLLPLSMQQNRQNKPQIFYILHQKPTYC